jgi:hypothetical protein
MSVEIPRVPSSPGVGARRKGPKAPPKLPLSAFSPPNTGTSDKFPLPPSPSTVHPDVIIDAHVSVPAAYLAQWKQEAGAHLGGQSGGVVLTLKGNDQAEVEEAMQLYVLLPPCFGTFLSRIAACNHPGHLILL